MTTPGDPHTEARRLRAEVFRLRDEIGRTYERGFADGYDRGSSDGYEQGLIDGREGAR